MSTTIRTQMEMRLDLCNIWAAKAHGIGDPQKLDAREEEVLRELGEWDDSEAARLEGNCE